ncbi:Dps family protein [Paraliobacillus salinarum]|uniref:Dps family protein n=1 Tax=Paraliobacillus salinarum TaxID=1158996 RepID=UPI0015F585D2|nr:DNA starvation/stationary phase protection protein [Paraliobacillus salinarum]
MTTSNEALKNHLNQLVATHGMFFTKLHQYHWYVKGTNFFVLHEKFEELYGDVNAKFDEFAERLLTIGGEPYSTLSEFIEHSSLSETPYKKEIPSDKMVELVVDDYKIIQSDLEKGIELAGAADDNVTEDLYIGYKTEIEKTLWMLTAYLGK